MIVFHRHTLPRTVGIFKLSLPLWGCTDINCHKLFSEHGLEFIVELLLGHLVIGSIAQRDPVLFVDRGAVV